MVSALQQQYLDAMGIDTWRPREAGAVATVPVPMRSFELPAAGFSAWLAGQNVARVSGNPVTVPLAIIGECVPEQPSESLTNGESASLLDAMLKALELRRDQLLIIELAEATGDTDTVAGVLADNSLRAVLFMGALPVESPVDSFAGRHTPGQTCCGVPMIASLHPHYLLANPAAKRIAWEDLKQVRSLLRDA